MVKTQAELAAEQVRDIKRQIGQQMAGPGEALARLERSNAAQGAEPKASSLLERIDMLAKRDAADWDEFVKLVRQFVGQKRADLEHLERLLGTK